MEKKAKRKKLFLGILTVFTIIMLVLTVVGLVVFTLQVSAYEASGIDEYQTYSRLYAFIPNDPDSIVSETLYQELREYGILNDCFVDKIGADLASGYTKEERISIAVSSKVSGIILEGDDSEETAFLIDQATAAGIPVVTVMTDAPGSSRCSFVGLNNYSAGVEYGEIILDAASANSSENISALVIMSAGDNNESVIYSAIQEKLQGSGIDLSSVAIVSDSAFSAEERIVDTLDEYTVLPDIVVCLSDINTRCAYQYIVDKNYVGYISFIGYYDSDTVLEGIDRGAIDATFSVDTTQVARYCVDALNEYIDSSYVSMYFSTDYVLIDRYNVSGYIEERRSQEASDEED